MALRVEPSGQACGARVTGVDLKAPLDSQTVAAIRAAWLEHHVLAFPDQHLNDDELERFTLCFGEFGDDPFFAPIAGRQHIAAIRREADEQTPLFAENWHADWSFQARPPSGTCLNAVEIPPVGGDTLFANQHAAWEALSPDQQARYADLIAIHSARMPYAPDGTYGARDKGRSMDIRPSEAALATQTHPLVPAHPETGRRGFYSTLGYIIGIEDMAQDEAIAMLMELQIWQGDDRFVYRHRWEPGMLVMWDNRSVLHKATGGYEGYRRELHRTTIAAWNG
ncbi:TauD/TfdA family dioxygenase [Novosphingobium sp.]|uniref:TauD/TfdA dioxygenase family protein n=1 Tax=Novosphingobium sp. TaxID=1874826 RepID=UPI0022C407E2|nr:TauD/TfdA family dioxygenase [Novosphingobium sp.]MCZ8017360.1 TauD/TfdA family dioxygenase [Novosphingobium sp.]MCZ8034117.1 TauD/TfdA family dioxygenase [Novosphingobium sp.]MCZ8051472.1 TauD/TfdA family dioxygenase [Novosphingobium sp.]MCZ8059818.1 TauD/TfdA family dioxygenase [Novosphingobium sp.]MCZ8231656.1 TauD/TfdA family dioxygenase [Novosphingobium sp.]